ncbi:RND transporter [Pedobacter yulinensis]|uniref:RND transporter n=1 Tax=Pedobacter yulinensis TaxID=2126353 RepID=A0A2T3HJJ2_9SPHI|nr:TolC family protein [Pedobacter yulinensis]PST82625.1 RND transporter [Pedobacter yulinensis]
MKPYNPYINAIARHRWKLPAVSWAAITLILLLAGGCKVSKDIALPVQALPATYRTASAPAADSSIALIPVQDFFTASDIRRLIDTALQRNNDLQLALENIEAAEALYSQARLGNVPQVNLNVTASTTRPSDNSLNGLSAGQFLKTTHIEDFNANLGLAWEADIWGKIRSQKLAARAAYLQTREARNAITTRVVAGVAEGYYGLLMTDAQLEIARKNVKLNDSTLRIIRLQFNSGQVTSLAVQQAEAQQLAAATLVPRLEQVRTLQENALSILTGQVPGPVERSGTLQAAGVADEFGTGLPAALLENRPDIRTAALALDEANARVGISKASMYPTLTISASGGVNSFKASNWFNVPAALFGVVSGGVTQPVFQRRQLKTAYELSKIEREKTVIRFRQAVLLAVGEVSDELVRVNKLKTEYELAEQRALKLQLAVRNAGLLFKNGMANYLEVITAQSALLQSELDLASIKTARLTAGVRLYRALGGGWK